MLVVCYAVDSLKQNKTKTRRMMTMTREKTKQNSCYLSLTFINQWDRGILLEVKKTIVKGAYTVYHIRLGAFFIYLRGQWNFLEGRKTID